MKDLSFLKHRLIAHRGYHNKNLGIPENSIVAFKKAINNNYIIELDVHITKDKNIVVFHDFNLKRVCGVNKKIEELTYNELLKYNLYDTKYKIPKLKDVLNLVNGKVPILIETKNDKFNGVLEMELSRCLDSYNGLFAVQSFFPFSILWFKKNRPHYIRGLLAGDFKTNSNINNLKKNISKTLISDIILKSDFIAYDIKALPNLYVDSKRKNKLILGWTVRNKKDYDMAKKYCDNLICENMDDYV